MTGEVRVCVDKSLATHRLEEAAERAMMERRGNAPDGTLLGDAINRIREFGIPDFQREAAVMLTSKKWEAGREIKVGWIPGPYNESDVLRERIRYYVNSLEAYMNLNFRFIGFNPDEADVRVSDERGGSWSYLGTDNLLIPRDEPTLQLGWLEPDMVGNRAGETEIRRTVQHEFLHAVDLGHEHSHPRNDRAYDKPYIYAWFWRTQGWDQQEVDQQFFYRYREAHTTFSDYDPDSIMHYEVPAEFLLDKSQAIGWNTRLSDGDRAFLRKVYA